VVFLVGEDDPFRLAGASRLVVAWRLARGFLQEEIRLELYLACVACHKGIGPVVADGNCVTTRIFCLCSFVGLATPLLRHPEALICCFDVSRRRLPSLIVRLIVDQGGLEVDELLNVANLRSRLDREQLEAFQLIQFLLQLLGLLRTTYLLLRTVILTHQMTIASAAVRIDHECEWLLVIEHGSMRVFCSG
jgi:hypothetical protein